MEWEQLPSPAAAWPLTSSTQMVKQLVQMSEKVKKRPVTSAGHLLKVTLNKTMISHKNGKE